MFFYLAHNARSPSWHFGFKTVQFRFRANGLSFCRAHLFVPLCKFIISNITSRGGEEGKGGGVGSIDEDFYTYFDTANDECIDIS